MYYDLGRAPDELDGLTSDGPKNPSPASYLKQALSMTAVLQCTQFNGAILFCTGMVILISFRRIQLENYWRDYDGWFKEFDVSYTK